jgi:N-acylneuraminate cytidylyltransferase
MKIAIIPARGGSKRIPRKNIKSFHGKPLIAYSIEAALKSGCFDRVIVTTDDNEIAEISKKHGAEIPFIRPSNVSDDFATTLDVIKHAINELSLQDTDVVCCLYATAPLIQITDIQKALQLLVGSELDYVFSATEFSFPIQRAIKINSDGLVDMFQKEHVNTRSQDLEKGYHDAGQFYFGFSRSFIENKNFFCGSKSRALLLPTSRVQDIDTLDDWKRAEIIYKIIQCENEAK